MNKFVLALGLLGASVVAQAAGIEWAKSYPEALATAKASKKLLMVDFYTDW
ncbi:MAG TPA: hypothetical protein VGE01_03240 [Fimbriimonas sp.]